MRLQQRGVALDLPARWEARIYEPRPDRPAGGLGAQDTTRRQGTSNTIVHLATFPMPTQRGDFGSNAVEIMGPGDIFVALIEYDPEAANTALFRRAGLPALLRASSFGPDRLQRALPGQAGTQVFFHADERAWCLYVVLGSVARADALVDEVNRLLVGIRLDRRPSPAPGAPVADRRQP